MISSYFVRGVFLVFKKAFLCYVIVISLVFSLFTANSFAESDGYDAATVMKIMEKTNVFDLKAKSAVLMDSISGNLLVEKNSHEKFPIASITKIMSMLLLMEAIDSGSLRFEDKVTVSVHSYEMGGSQVYLKPGEEFTVNEMLKAIAVHSANDATVAIAEKIAGSEDVFVSMMNEKAKALGMNDTNFLDCSGLTDEGHYSSAHDIAVMSRELISKHPKILEYSSIWIDSFRNGQFSLNNTNKLIRFYQGTNGLKTGFTTKAGYCLSATAKRNNLQLVAVVLGEPDSNTRFAESRKLLDHGFANYEVSQVNKKDEGAGSFEIKNGMKTKANAIYGEDINLLLNKSQKGKITREIRMFESVGAPVELGQKIGEVVYKINEKQVGTADLVSDSKVEKASFIRLFFRMLLEWVGIGRS